MCKQSLQSAADIADDNDDFLSFRIGRELMARMLAQMQFPQGPVSPHCHHDTTVNSCSTCTSEPDLQDKESAILGQWFSFESGFLVTPRACTQEVKQSVCPSVVVATKIARSQVLGIWATPKHNEPVDIGEKLAAVCFELFERAYKRHK